MGGATQEYNKFTPKFNKCFVIAAYETINYDLIRIIDDKADKLMAIKTKDLKKKYGV